MAKWKCSLRNNETPHLERPVQDNLLRHEQKSAPHSRPCEFRTLIMIAVIRIAVKEDATCKYRRLRMIRAWDGSEHF